jgi:uncharacterized protein (TIRG00374 family)
VLLKGARFWIGLGVSLIFLALFFYRTDVQAIGNSLKTANYLYVLPALGVYTVALWFRTIRWRYLLRPLGTPSDQRLFPIVLIGYMANDILPARIGELVRAYVLGEKERMSKTAILATIAVERIFDGVALILFLLVLLPLFPLAAWLRGLAQLMAVIFFGGLVALLAVARFTGMAQRVASSVLQFLPPPLQVRATRLVELFLTGLSALRSPRVLGVVLLTSLLTWITEAAMYWIIFWSFGQGQPYHLFLLTASVANLAITLPSSPGGIGPFDFFVKQTVMLADVATGTAAAYAILLRAVLHLPVIFLGLVFLWLQQMSLAQVAQQGKGQTTMNEASSELGTGGAR